MSQIGPDRSPRRGRRRAAKVLVMGLLAVSATACTSSDFPRLGMPQPITTEGPQILSLWQGSWAAAFVVGGIVWGLIIWSVIFHRRSRHKREIPPQVRYNVPIEMLYTAIPMVIVLVFFYFTARDENNENRVDNNAAAVINVVGRQWSWTFNYNFDPSGVAKPTGAKVYDVGTPAQIPTLYLPQNEKVEFVLTSPDVIHDFWVPAFLYKMDVIPGRVNKFEVTPTTLGTFDGRCAELCGVDHSRMLFTVKVVTPAQYQQHLQQLEQQGQTGTLPYELTPIEKAPDQLGSVNQ